MPAAQKEHGVHAKEPLAELNISISHIMYCRAQWILTKHQAGINEAGWIETKMLHHGYHGNPQTAQLVILVQSEMALIFFFFYKTYRTPLHLTNHIAYLSSENCIN